MKVASYVLVAKPLSVHLSSDNFQTYFRLLAVLVRIRLAAVGTISNTLFSCSCFSGHSCSGHSTADQDVMYNQRDDPKMLKEHVT